MTGTQFASLGGRITGTRFDFRNVDIRFHQTQLLPSRFSDITFWVTIISFLVQNEWTISRSGRLSGNSNGSLGGSMTGTRFGTLGGSITGTRFAF